MKVIKRNGQEVEFDKDKIINAMKKGNDNMAENDRIYYSQILECANGIEEKAKLINRALQVEEIQDLVENYLMDIKAYALARHYMNYRYVRALEREKEKNLEEEMISILECKNIQNSNANVDENTFSGRKHECTSLVLKNLALNNLVRKEIGDAYKNNYIYIHDFDSFYSGEHNCAQINFNRLLENGFCTRNGDVRPPKSLSTAMQQVAVIIQCQSQVQFGGCGSMHIDYDLAPFVKLSFAKHYKNGCNYVEEIKEISPDIQSMLDNVKEFSIEDKRYKEYAPKAYKYAMDMLERECMQSAQGLFHNLNTLESRAGSQVPFSSLNFGRDTSPEGRMVIKSLLQASIDGVGKYHKTPIFPISIFQVKDGVNKKPGDPNYDLKLLALESTSKRLYPNFVNCDSANAHEDMNDIDTYMSAMGCRTMLGYDVNGLGYKKVGRGNISPITIVLPKIGIEYGICTNQRKEPDIKGFWNKLDKILHITEQGLLDRFYHIANQKPSSAPFMYKNGTMEGALECKENVFEMVKHGTNAIGFIGLAETLQALFGKNQLDEKAREFGLEIVKHIYNYSKEATERNHLNFSCYFTPAEGCCYTIMNKLKKEFGEIKDVTENSFLTNSTHIPVWENIDIFKKIDIESEFVNYGTGGNITYVELEGSIRNNLKALEKIVDYAMDKGINYFAMNLPIDDCDDCGYSAEIDNCCPICGSTNISRLRRVTGYLTGSYLTAFNKGKQEEVQKRFKHMKITNLEK